MQITLLFCYWSFREYLVIHLLASFPCCGEWRTVRNIGHHQSEPTIPPKVKQFVFRATNKFVAAFIPLTQGAGLGGGTGGHHMVTVAPRGVLLTEKSPWPSSWSLDLSAHEMACMSIPFLMAPILWREREHLLSTFYVPHACDSIPKQLLVQKTRAILWWWNTDSGRWVTCPWSHRCDQVVKPGFEPYCLILRTELLSL